MGELGQFYVRGLAVVEYAALGFEYGYSSKHRRPLCVGKRNSATSRTAPQIIMDNFIAAAEEKWGQHSGLVMLCRTAYEARVRSTSRPASNAS